MRGRPPSIREADILDAARDVFRAEGHATTTAKIAERAGVSEGILFYRYKSKEGLLAAVIRRETAPPEALRAIAKTAAQRSVAQNLARVVETLLDAVFRAHPFLMLVDTSSASGRIRRVLSAQAKTPPPQRIVELVVEYFQAEMRLGRVRAIDPVPIARALFGGCVDYVRARRGRRDERDRTAFVSGLVDVVLHGAAKPLRRRRTR